VRDTAWTSQPTRIIRIVRSSPSGADRRP
jgi:hypothetical protein